MSREFFIYNTQSRLLKPLTMLRPSPTSFDGTGINRKLKSENRCPRDRDFIYMGFSVIVI